MKDYDTPMETLYRQLQLHMTMVNGIYYEIIDLYIIIIISIYQTVHRNSLIIFLGIVYNIL